MKRLALLLAGIVALAARPALAQGGALLYAQDCASCHGVRGEGSKDGPPLVGTPSVYVHFMLDTGRMPAPEPWANTVHKAPQFDEHDIDDIVSYVASLSPRGVDRELPVVTPGDMPHGRQLFAENCAHCHGAAGNGASVGYDLVAPSLKGASAMQVAEAIRSGPENMPRFGRDVLSDRDVDDIVAYVGYAKQADAAPDQLNAGGFSLAHIGPVAEGIIAWIFGIGVLMLFVRKIGTVR